MRGCESDRFGLFLLFHVSGHHSFEFDRFVGIKSKFEEKRRFDFSPISRTEQEKRRMHVCLSVRLGFEIPIRSSGDGSAVGASWLLVILTTTNNQSCFKRTTIHY